MSHPTWGCGSWEGSGEGRGWRSLSVLIPVGLGIPVSGSLGIYMLARSSLTQSVNIFPFYVKSVSDTSKVRSCFPAYSLFDPNQTT